MRWTFALSPWWIVLFACPLQVEFLKEQIFFLQYCVPHSKLSLQLAPTGFMLFQRHRSDRLVRRIKPFQSSGTGSELTWTAQIKQRRTERTMILSWRVPMLFADQTQDRSSSVARLVCCSMPPVLKAVVGLGRSYPLKDMKAWFPNIPP